MARRLPSPPFLSALPIRATSSVSSRQPTVSPRVSISAISAAPGRCNNVQSQAGSKRLYVQATPRCLERPMPVINRIAEFYTAMMAWRHDIHAHPEMAFSERRTSDLVAAELGKLGIEIHRGLAGTGVVGTLRSGITSRTRALRADMDALPT